MIDSIEANVKGTRLLLKQGDLTEEDADALVNAANSSLLGGGGVDGAIHHRGGPAILDACKEIQDRLGYLATGKAVITVAGELKARWVIHTVGPIWTGGQEGEDGLLADCYQNSLALAQEHGLRSVAFPSISTGAYRFPVNRASRIALETVRDFLLGSPLDQVSFVLFSEKDYQSYTRALQSIL